MPPLVIDTNVVLDAFVFSDAKALALRRELEAGALRWIATADMREELRRVLDYPQIAKRLAFHGLAAAGVLDRFDRHAALQDAAPRAQYACKDPDDQKFIDLAVQHRALLLSKDREVLKMRKRLVRLGCPPVTALYG